MTDIERRARARVLDDHREVLVAIRETAAAVADGWEGEATDERAAAVDALRDGLVDRGVLSRLPRVLADVGRAVELRMVASPVPAPPYVCVTGTGVVMRLPTDTRRLVISVETFGVDRRPTRYRFDPGPVEQALTVAVRRTPPAP